MRVVDRGNGLTEYYSLDGKLLGIKRNGQYYDANGKKIDTHEKRIYAPNVVGIVNGKADKMTTGISSMQNDAYMDLTEEMINETYSKFECVINCVLDNKNATCPLDKAC